MTKLSKESVWAVFKYRECIFLTFIEKDHNGIKLCWSAGSLYHVWPLITFYHFFLDLNNSLITVTAGFVFLNIFYCVDRWRMNDMLINYFVCDIFDALKWTEMKVKSSYDRCINGGS